MAKLFDKLMNRVIKGKLIVEQGDELGDGVVKIETSSNISELSDEVLDSLKVGDVVQKITGNMKHCYIVTYKEEHHGICLSYFACGYLETISYDYTAGHWVFNSKDVCEVQEKITSSTDLVAKTLSQSEANWELIFTPTISYRGCDVNIDYWSIKVINGCLHIITNFTLTNNTGSNLDQNTLGFTVDLGELPENIAKKIIGNGGVSLFDNTAPFRMCCSYPLMQIDLDNTGYPTGQTGLCYLVFNNNHLVVYFKIIAAIPNEHRMFETARVELDLI